MNFHLITSNTCNLNCKYCGGGEIKQNKKIIYTINELKQFLDKNTKKGVINFYGGEPLLNIPFIEEVMDNIKGYKFVIQTNGLLLNKLKNKYLRNFHSILVSIDGRPEITDNYRSKDIYKKIIENCKLITRKKFNGDLIARMTVSENTDIYEDVTHLLNLKNPVFNHIHWQCDFMWDDDPKNRWNNIEDWIKNNYNPGIKKLVKLWVNKMFEGLFLGITPFIPIAKSLIFKERANIRCGSGYDFFTITPEGTITVCPIPPADFNKVGNIKELNPANLFNCSPLGEPCNTCDFNWVCGGRCWFTNKTKFWGKDWFNKICETVKFLINSIKMEIPKINNLIENGVLSSAEFNYPEINNGCEIIP